MNHDMGCPGACPERSRRISILRPGIALHFSPPRGPEGLNFGGPDLSGCLCSPPWRAKDASPRREPGVDARGVTHSPLQRAKDSAPHRGFVEFHAMLLEEREKFVLERRPQMMPRLVAYGSDDGFPARFTYAERCIQTLTFLGFSHPQLLTFLGYEYSKTQLF